MQVHPDLQDVFVLPTTMQVRAFNKPGYYEMMDNGNWGYYAVLDGDIYAELYFEPNNFKRQFCTKLNGVWFYSEAPEPSTDPSYAKRISWPLTASVAGISMIVTKLSTIMSSGIDNIKTILSTCRPSTLQMQSRLYSRRIEDLERIPAYRPTTPNTYETMDVAYGHTYTENLARADNVFGQENFDIPPREMDSIANAIKNGMNEKVTEITSDYTPPNVNFIQPPPRISARNADNTGIRIRSISMPDV